ncbi:MAG: porin family protein [Helicobacteraceae bacterium]|jgi:opacity protein-like surface antigen|nr:porin family protein [Helicobacteraceae bacterium]
MKKLLAVVLATLFANGALLAKDSGAEGWQISAGLHMSKFKVESESENNTPISLAIAKEIMKTKSGDLLLEASLMTPEKYELSYYGIVDIEIKTKMVFFGSLYYQFNTSVPSLKPYAGLGLGLAFLEAKGGFCVTGYCESDSTSDTSLAYQLAIGANYFFNKNVAAGLGYAIRDYGSIEDVNVDSSGLFLSATYKF